MNIERNSTDCPYINPSPAFWVKVKEPIHGVKRPIIPGDFLLIDPNAQPTGLVLSESGNVELFTGQFHTGTVVEIGSSNGL